MHVTVQQCVDIMARDGETLGEIIRHLTMGASELAGILDDVNPTLPECPGLPIVVVKNLERSK